MQQPSDYLFYAEVKAAVLMKNLLYVDWGGGVKLCPLSCYD